MIIGTRLPVTPKPLLPPNDIKLLDEIESGVLNLATVFIHIHKSNNYKQEYIIQNADNNSKVPSKPMSELQALVLKVVAQEANRHDAWSIRVNRIINKN